jgi:ribonuclease E
MTRKRIGTGLLEAFSEPCEHCNGRGLHIHAEPIIGKKASAGEVRPGRSSRRDRRRKGDKAGSDQAETPQPKLEATATPGEASPADLIPVEFANRKATVRAEPAEADAETVGAAATAADLPAGDVAAADTLAADTGEATAGGPDGAAAEPEDRIAGQQVPAEPAPAMPLDEATGRDEQTSAGDAGIGSGPAEAVVDEAPAPKRRRRRAQRPAGSPDAVGSTSDQVEPAQV